MADYKNFSLVNLGGAAGDIVKELFGPSARNMGKVFGAVTGLVYSYFKKYEFYNAIEEEIMVKNLREFKEQLDKIPEEEIVTVPPEIVHPIFERFEYASNEIVRKAFQNLLINASRFKTADVAHPAFIQIIDRLSPDEGILLRYFFRYRTVPFIRTAMQSEISPEKVIKVHLGDWEVDISDGFGNWLFSEPQTDKLIFPNSLSMYIDNLISLGLLGNREEPPNGINRPSFDNLWKSYLEKHSFDEKLKPMYEEGVLVTTAFAVKFLRACTPEGDF